MPRRSVRWHVLGGGVLAVGVAAALVHAFSYLTFISDDAYISLRYAKRLLEGQGLTWTDGPRVEGYTNLLWVLAGAGLARLGVDWLYVPLLLGVSGTIVTLVAVAAATWPYRRRGAMPLVSSVGLLAASGPIAVWCVGGLESPGVTAFLAAGLAILTASLSRAIAPNRDLVRDHQSRGRVPVQSFLAAGVCLGMMCLTRADGAVLCAGVFIGALIAARFSRRAWRTAILVMAVPAICVAGQIVFRWTYYGDFVPNSARVKVAFTPERLSSGLAYVLEGAVWLAPLVLLGAAGATLALRRRRSHPTATVLVCTLVVWLAYIAFIGGDIFPARRHWAPAIVCLAMLGAAAIEQLRARRRFLGPAAPAAAIGALILCAAVQQLDFRNRLALDERWEVEGRMVGQMLKTAYAAQQPLLAIDAAGALPFYAELPALDMLGLNDFHIARHKPAEFGRGGAGHDLGDGCYVLERKPDLVVFGLPTGGVDAMWPGGKQMEQMPEFHRDYRLVPFSALAVGRFLTRPPERVDALIWVRVEDSRIGVERSPGRIRIPGYLLARRGGAAAELDSAGRLGARASRDRSGAYERLALPPGAWSLSVESEGAVSAIVRQAGSTLEIAAGPPPLLFVSDAPESRGVDVFISPVKSDSAHVRSVSLER
ncbi:MAG: hypothetical protein U1D55_10850 [Phycisphaerae bacterium]